MANVHEWLKFYSSCATVKAATAKDAEHTIVDESEIMENLDVVSIVHTYSCECGGEDEPLEHDD